MGGSNNVWVVYFGNGFVGLNGRVIYPRDPNIHVRLVRASQ